MHIRRNLPCAALIKRAPFRFTGHEDIEETYAFFTDLGRFRPPRHYRDKLHVLNMPANNFVQRINLYARFI